MTRHLVGSSGLRPAGVRHGTGLSLIEMLIALVVLSFGLLGLAGLQAYSLKNNHNSYFRSQATVLGYDLLDQIRAKRADFLEAGGAQPDTSDVATWSATVAATLPAGQGAVACADGVCQVTVSWNDSRGADAVTQSIVLSSQL